MRTIITLKNPNLLCIMAVFGEWTNHLDILSEQYKHNVPFSHVLLKNFFREEYIQRLLLKFPKVDDTWYKYDNPLERKYALNKFDDLPEYSDIFNTLQSPEFVQLVSKITGISNLENDPHLHGAGIHFYPPNGKLDMHLDYSIHPLSGKERRVNLIIYLNRDWKQEWNGDIQLWNSDFTEPVKKYYPEYNTAILFRTNDLSYHGLPSQIKCPDDIGRQSLAIYYVSDATATATPRYKAEYRKLPWQPTDDRLDQLYHIRKTRIITPEDLERIYPDWRTDGNGYW